MKRSCSKERLAALAGLGLALASLVTAAPAAAVDYGEYHSVAEVERQLGEWAKASGKPLQLASIGKSSAGKDLWVATLASPGPVPPEERPAVFVGANIVGFHNAGTEAALDLIATLLAAEGEAAKLLATRTFYVAPMLNPDAHDGLFAAVAERRSGTSGRLDRDRDGFVAEDGADDLDGDGRITRLRIPDPAGGWLPHPQEPRLMVRADAAKGWAGGFRVETEGRDDDEDGAFNEDGAGGAAPDRNFPHAFPHPDPGAGPWPGSTPETKAVLDFLLAHKNVALAVVYGPANNLLAAPEGLGRGADAGTLKLKVPTQIAGALGLDPEQEYTIDEIWEVAKDHPVVKRQGLSKDQVAQFLGAGPATKVADEDQALLTELGKAYKERLKAAGLDSERPGGQYGEGGLTPWAYYQYGALTLELDVWGVPKVKKEEAGKDEPLTLKRLGGMSKEEFLKLSAEQVADFLKRIKAPPQFTAEALIERVQTDQVTPEQMAKMAQQMGAKDEAGAEKDDAATERRREVLAWVDANAPDAFSAWKQVTLSDGTKAEAGGLDPFVDVAPPLATLAPAAKAHTATVLDLAGKLAAVEILAVETESLGGGVYRVRAVAGNRGTFPTHTKLAVKARAHLPVRLTLEAGDGAVLLAGTSAVTSESLEGKIGTLEAEWLVQAGPKAKLAVTLKTDNAGSDRETIDLAQARVRTAGERPAGGKGASR